MCVKDRQIGIPVFTTVMLLAGSPLPSDAGAAPGAVLLPALMVVGQQQPSAPPAPLPVPLPTPAPADPLPPIGPVLQTEPLVPDPSASPPPGILGTQEDVIVVGRNRRGDPLAPINEGTFDATQAIDRAFVGPVALAYKNNVPSPFRDGLRNFLNNLREPVVFVNYLLQLKPGKAGETLGRFAINTTVGVAGLVDVAKRRPFRLPRRRNGFANTLGFYGVGPGPFFFLPLIGATTLRDLVGNGIDQFVPIGPIRPFSGGAYTIPVAVLSSLDYRAEIDDDLTKLRASRDPYAAVRKFYLDRRQAEIDALRGRKPAPAAAP